MTGRVQLAEAPPDALELRLPDGRPLLRYVYAPAVPDNESPRPYAHPVYSIDGDTLTNFRPNDHPWHHGLSLTLTSVDGVNFWGGPSYAASDGTYRWRGDQGRQVHREWLRRDADESVHTVDWLAPSGAILLAERRTLRASLADNGWSLEWESVLRNVSGRDLSLHTYHSGGGLAGSHYTGLQFRGARGLLDEHGDPAIALANDRGCRTEAEVHGAPASWLEWHAQHDTTLRRTRLRFESLCGPIPWFLRRQLPLLAFAPHREQPLMLGAGAELTLAHRLGIFRAS